MSEDHRRAPDALPEGSPPPGLEQDRAAAMPAMDFSAIASQTVYAQPDWRERLMALPTPGRIALGCVGALVVGGAVLAVQGARQDLDPDALSRLALQLSLVIAAAGLGVGLALRGPHERPLGALGAAAAWLGIALPAGLALIPGIWPGEAAISAWSHMWCLQLGALSAALTTLLLLTLQRMPTTPGLLGAAGAGGLVGFAVQGLHCAWSDPLHLLVGHGLAGLVVGGAALGIQRWRAR